MPTRRMLVSAAVGSSLLAIPVRTIDRAAAQEKPLTETGVAYGEVDGKPLLLDISHPPTRDKPRPAVIVIHGGAWTQGISGPSDMRKPAQELGNAGYVVFNIEYRLLDGEPGHNAWPAQLDDVQRAVRWVRAHADTYGVDPGRIASYGHSSGGHLAAMLGVRDTRDNSDASLADYSSRVDAVVDLAGDMDLTIPYPEAFDRQVAIDFLGGTVAEVPEAYRDASPLSFVDEDTAPFLVFHGSADDANPIEHSLRMVEALHAADVEVVYAQFPRVGHIDLANWRLVGPETLAFLERHLEPNR